MAKWTFEPGHTAAEFRARHMMVSYVRGPKASAENINTSRHHLSPNSAYVSRKSASTTNSRSAYSLRRTGESNA